MKSIKDVYFQNAFEIEHSILMVLDYVLLYF